MHGELFARTKSTFTSSWPKRRIIDRKIKKMQTNAWDEDDGRKITGKWALINKLLLNFRNNCLKLIKVDFLSRVFSINISCTYFHRAHRLIAELRLIMWLWITACVLRFPSSAIKWSVFRFSAVVKFYGCIAISSVVYLSILILIIASFWSGCPEKEMHNRWNWGDKKTAVHLDAQSTYLKWIRVNGFQ